MHQVCALRLLTRYYGTRKMRLLEFAGRCVIGLAVSFGAFSSGLSSFALPKRRARRHQRQALLAARETAIPIQTVNLAVQQLYDCDIV